jgi:hypothetical protein
MVLFWCLFKSLKTFPKIFQKTSHQVTLAASGSHGPPHTKHLWEGLGVVIWSPLDFGQRATLAMSKTSPSFIWCNQSSPHLPAPPNPNAHPRPQNHNGKTILIL